MKRGKYVAINPTALSTSVQAPGGNTHLTPCVSAIQGTNAELMEQVAPLWICKDDLVVDTTWGRGVFWKNLPNVPVHKHDLKIDGVDCRKLPYANGQVDVLVLDPPYRPTHGSKLFDNGLVQAYGLGTEQLDTIEDVLTLYRDAILEANRVLKVGGRILVKCQDLSYGNRLHLVTLDVFQALVQAGFEFADQFILVNTPNLSGSKWERQGRARRSHSVLWVFIKA